MSSLIAADRAPSSLASWSMSSLPELQDGDALGLPLGDGGLESSPLTADDDDFEQKSPLSPVHPDLAAHSKAIAGENCADSNCGQISPVHQSSLAGSIASLDPPNPVEPGEIGRSPRGQDESGKATTESSLTASLTVSSPKRKRKPNPRKAKTTTPSRNSIAASDPDPTNSPADSARKQALERNQRAAARCRDKKRLHVGQLQEDVRVQKAEHAFLKEQIMSMEEQVQQLAALLVAHAGEDSCKSSLGEIQ
ncbi:hypothetical protein EDD36DRAFT_469936 [Exophiala viscosa]|uniref:BZIP domain-containing protein n=1 Tax=Exophiala viscosa TaxID=2486360 RepID=A0AAN6DK83_9EURO|nr:hypothetical protein EDD36DRAFT_469936 [Exophiala viscosa]